MTNNTNIVFCNINFDSAQEAWASFIIEGKMVKFTEAQVIALAACEADVANRKSFFSALDEISEQKVSARREDIPAQVVLPFSNAF